MWQPAKKTERASASLKHSSATASGAAGDTSKGVLPGYSNIGWLRDGIDALETSRNADMHHPQNWLLRMWASSSVRDAINVSYS